MFVDYACNTLHYTGNNTIKCSTHEFNHIRDVITVCLDVSLNFMSTFVGSTNSGRDSTGSLSTSYEMEKYLSILSSLTPAGNTSKSGESAGGMSNTLSMTLTPSSSYEIQRISPARSGTARILGGIFDHSKRSSRFLGGAIDRGEAGSGSSSGMSHFTMAHTSSGLSFSAKSPRGN